MRQSAHKPTLQWFPLHLPWESQQKQRKPQQLQTCSSFDFVDVVPLLKHQERPNCEQSLQLTLFLLRHRFKLNNPVPNPQYNLCFIHQAESHQATQAFVKRLTIRQKGVAQFTVISTNRIWNPCKWAQRFKSNTPDISLKQLVSSCRYWLMEGEKIIAPVTNALNATPVFLHATLFLCPQHSCSCASALFCSCQQVDKEKLFSSSRKQLPYQPIEWIKALHYKLKFNT